MTDLFEKLYGQRYIILRKYTKVKSVNLYYVIIIIVDQN